MATPWDASTYDRSSAPQQAWAADVRPPLDYVRLNVSAVRAPAG